MLTDLEISKRIAEIEGEILSGVGEHNVYIKCKPSLVGNVQFNPLTDDALCFQLMVKYEVNINRYYDLASISSDYTNKPDLSSVSFFTDDASINKAICLAIIEAHS